MEGTHYVLRTMDTVPLWNTVFTTPLGAREYNALQVRTLSYHDRHPQFGAPMQIYLKLIAC